ncbi:MAG: helix-turn-helix domain-containing protein [Thermoplasmata archaeon]|nr:helix-turn-helix domain-containing protein [Thermoplasmata archaeon]
MLELPTRRRIAAFVADHPGTSARALQRGLGLGWGESTYHLGLLVNAGHLARERAGRRDYYFPSELSEADRRLLIAFQGPVPRRLLVTLGHHPGLTFTELAAELAIARSTMAFHLRFLLLSGLIEVERLGGDRRYRVLDEGRVLDFAKRYPAEGSGWAERFSETFGGLLRD